MNPERLSRFLVAGLLLSFLAVRAYFTIRLREKHGEIPGVSHRIDSEGRVNFAFRRFLIAPMLAVATFLFFIKSPWLVPFAMDLPSPLVITSALIGMCGILFLVWVHRTLGREWSAKLKIRADHQLIRTGPYARIRHPMYTALFTIYGAIGVTSSNFLILVPLVLAVLSILVRIPKEESMLMERFGADYRSYKEQTGRFLPRP